MERSTNMKSDNQDRISSLPDCLLHLIMSFLTAHEAVRTCVLSKRWKNLWTTLPFLNFDLVKFEQHMRAWHDFEKEDKRPRKADFFRLFGNVVNSTLVLREATDLAKFRLSCWEIPNGWFNLFISSWIRYALKRNPQVLDIDVWLEDSLPPGLFSCASLVDLKLLCPHNELAPVVNLPCIKRLHLGHLYLSQDFMKKLLCGCPVLEFLQLDHCDMRFSTIQSQSLKHLKIDDGYEDKEARTDIVMVLINSPNLLSFHYKGCAQYIGNNVILNMPSLISAIICMDRCNHPSYIGSGKILTGISSVKCVKLCGFWIKELLESELPKLPMFQNVKELSVDDLCLKCNFNLLASFIEHFPNLKILSLCHASYKCEVEVHGSQKSLKIAPFKCMQLNLIHVRLFKCDKNSHWVMKYLLDGTQNLRTMINMSCLDGCHPYSEST